MPTKIDTEVPYSPGWWLKVLATALHDRRVGRENGRRYTRKSIESSRVRPGLELLADYMAGDPPLREDVHSTWAAAFRQYLRMGRLNIAPRIPAARANRMGIRDFRTASAGDELGDAEARNLMRRNELRLKVREVHDNMLGLGDGYTIVTPPDATRPWSLITAESPLHCITAHDAATGETLAGLKMFRDEWDSTDFAYLFLPGEVYVAKASVGTSTLFRSRGFVVTDQWDWDYDKFDNVPGNQVAMVRFRNKDGVGEFESHLDTLDRINDKIFNEWWIGKIQAFKQRALKMPDEDIDDTEDDEDTPDVDDLAGMFTSAPDAMWQLPAGADIWESGTTDLTPIINSIKGDLQWLAFTAALPLHLITPDAANGSAEGATTQKEEHTFEISDRRDRAEGGWARTMSLAFLFQGMTVRADVSQIEPIWGPLELHSLTEKGNAVAQMWGRVPSEAIYTDVLQYSPADVVDRLRGLRAQDQLYGVQPPQPGQQP
ncbi:MAG: hypothetical protein HOV78_11700 [Hamadaea sp.]|nr:hypothetical protein [Hamadaea sp.]